MIPDPRMVRIYEPEDVPVDVLAAADFRRDELKHTFACANCGNLDPVRIDANGWGECCVEFPRCSVCKRWTGDGEFLPKSVGGVCTYCVAAWMKMQEAHR